MHTFDGIIVPSPQMKSYAEGKKVLKPIVALPFLYNEHLPVIHHRDTTTIVIPGTVNQRSRDYYMVLETLQCMNSNGFDCPVNLILLGQCKGKEAMRIKEQFLALKFHWLQVSTYDEAVPQATYDRLMLEADFYLLPLQRKWTYGIVNERGGTTCLSGNIGDMVRYGMPVLLPKSYQIEENLLPLVTYFDTDVRQAAGVWTDFIKNKTYNQVKLKTDATIPALQDWLRTQLVMLVDH